MGLFCPAAVPTSACWCALGQWALPQTIPSARVRALWHVKRAPMRTFGAPACARRAPPARFIARPRHVSKKRAFILNEIQNKPYKYVIKKWIKIIL